VTQVLVGLAAPTAGAVGQRPPRGAEPVDELGDRGVVLGVRAEVVGAGEGVGVVLQQRRGQREVARQRLQHVLPGPHRVRAAQHQLAAAGPGPGQVGHQAVLGPVPAADDVARPAGGQPHHRTARRGLGLRVEVGTPVGLDHQLLGGLARAVRVVPPERVGLPERPAGLVVQVALVAGDHHDGARPVGGPHRVEHRRRAVDVDRERLRRAAVPLAHHRAGSQVQHDVGPGAGDHGVDGVPVADVADHVVVQDVGDPGDLEQRRVGLRRQCVPGGPRAQRGQPQRQPRALEAGVPGHEHVPATQCRGMRSGHGRTW
ncbi:Hypothetical protein KLENKIAIHU_2795, partial [Klenkia terrae]